MTHTSLTFALPVRGLFILDAAFLRAWLEPKRVEVEPRFGDGHIQTGEYIQGKRYLDTKLHVDPGAPQKFIDFPVHNPGCTYHVYVSLSHSLRQSQNSSDRPISRRSIAPFLSICRRPSRHPSLPLRPSSTVRLEILRNPTERPIVLPDSWPP